MAIVWEVLLAHTDRVALDNLTLALRRTSDGQLSPIPVRSRQELEAVAFSRQPKIIVIDGGLSGFGDDLIQTIRSSCQAPILVALDPGVAAPPGVVGILPRPLEDHAQRLVSHVMYLLNQGSARERQGTERSAAERSAPTTESRPSALVSPAPPQPPKQAIRTNGIFVVWGPENGVGRKTVAINLAASFAFYGGYEVLYIDLRRPYSSLRYLLPIKTESYSMSIYALCQRAPTATSGQLHFDLGMIRENLINIRYDETSKETMKLLLGPLHEGLAYNEYTDRARLVTDLLSIVRKHYQYIIVDIGTDVTDGWHVEAIHSADRFLLVTTLHEPYIKILRRKINEERFWRQINFDPANVDLILNRYREKSPLRPEEAGRQLGIEPRAVLPDVPDEMEGCTSGPNPMPIMARHKEFPASVFVMEFKNLVNTYDSDIFPETPLPQRRRSIWPFR